jgi:hypothetical protein
LQWAHSQVPVDEARQLVGLKRKLDLMRCYLRRLQRRRDKREDDWRFWPVIQAFDASSDSDHAVVGAKRAIADRNPARVPCKNARAGRA